MRIRSKLIGALVAGAVVLALAGGRARAATSSNYWNGATGNYNTGANWTPATVPSTTNAWAIFTNNAAVAYTVQLSAVSTSGPVRVTSDKITVDPNGYKWVAYEANDIYGGDPNQTHWISATSGEQSTIKFSSSQSTNTTGVAGGNVVDFQNGRGGNLGMDVGFATTPSTITIDKSLGNAVTVLMGNNLFMNANLTVDGAGSQFQHVGGGTTGYSGNWNIQNGGYFSDVGAPIFAGGTITVNNATIRTAGINLGNLGRTYVFLTNNAVWNSYGLILLNYNLNRGDLIVNGSTINNQGGMQIGNSIYQGRAEFLTGSSVALSNGYLIVNSGNNTLIVNNSTLYLGMITNGVSYNGGLTNRAAMLATGTITGNGSSNFLFRNEGHLIIGSAISPVTNITISAVTTNVYTSVPGVLTLNKGSLELAAGSSNYFQFSDSTLSRIVASNGYARLQGTNIFALAMGAATPVHGVKYGLGVYDFVIGTNVNNTPQYDNLVNLLTNTYHLQYGVDFNYGVVNLGGGLFALELAFVPEPSTVMLLALGGLLVWRRIVKRHTK